ncbi:MAG: dUTP diphosphatase [Lachnospiraceae bacterium]|nr:dUTP diphosphatase [Lachnospiraceae bacterium]
MGFSMNIKKLREGAVLPTYGSKGAAGMDLYACLDESQTETQTIAAGDTAFIKTGVAVAIPEGYVGLIFARSGLSCKEGLAPANKVGVIDSDYRGELIVALHNHSKEEKSIAHGDRIAQLVIMPFEQVVLNEVEDLDETERNAAGFGSTGRN